MNSTAQATRPANGHTQQTQQQAPTQQDANAALLNQMIDRVVEYTPFLGKEPIKLTPRMVQQFLSTRTKSGKVCDYQQATKFVMLCKARGLNPWEGDAFIVGYDSKDGPTFSLITAHQAFLKRAEVHPEYDGMESGVLVRRNGEVIELPGDFTDEGDVLVGGWATVYFKNRSHPMKKRLKLATFNKPFGRWNEDKAGMIVKCAEADALRSAFPNSLGGMYLEGEMPAGGQEETPAQQPAPRPATKTDGLAARLGAKTAPPAPVELPEPPPPEFDDQAQPEPPQADAPPVMEPEPPAQPDPEALEKEDFCRQVREELARAQDRKAFEAIGADINEHAEWLGKETVERLLAEYRARYNEVFPQPTRSGKKQQPMLPMS